MIEVEGRIEHYDAVTPEERFNVTFMYALEEPRILRGLSPLTVIKWPFGDVWVNASVGLRAFERATEQNSKATRAMAIADFHPKLFSRMLAKIGHSFAVAEVGLDRFKPLLPAAILGIDPWYPGYLVGGDPHRVAPSEYDSEVGLRRIFGSTGQEYVAARIRLFGDLGAPVYWVVVGEL